MSMYSTTRKNELDEVVETCRFTLTGPDSFQYDSLDSTAIDAFAFLAADGELISKLKDVKDKIDEAVLVDGAFLFDNGSIVKNLENAQTTLNTMIDDLIAQIEALHGEFSDKIADIRTEMADNYGWAKIYNCSMSVNSD